MPLFNAAGFAFLYMLNMLTRMQGVLLFNPVGMNGISPDLAFNTVSFVANTNWQDYGGESTMSSLV